MSVTLQDLVTTTTATIQDVVPDNAGFGVVAYLTDSTLDGTERTKTYTGQAGLVQAGVDQAAGDLTADALNFVTRAFGAQIRPQSVMVIRCDVDNSETGGVETPTIALNAAEAAGAQFFYVCASANGLSDANLVLASAWCASRRKIFAFEDDSADWLTSGVPSAFSTIVTNRNTAMFYAGTIATDKPGASTMASSAAMNPDVVAPAFAVRVPSNSIPNLTGTQYGHLETNGGNAVVDVTTGQLAPTSWTGRTLTGETIKAVFAKFWFEIRSDQTITQAFSNYTALNKPFPADSRGANEIRSRIVDVLETGFEAGHFNREILPSPGYTVSVTIDIATKQATVVGSVGLLDGLESVVTTFSLTRGL